METRAAAGAVRAVAACQDAVRPSGHSPSAGQATESGTERPTALSSGEACWGHSSGRSERGSPASRAAVSGSPGGRAHNGWVSSSARSRAASCWASRAAPARALAPEPGFAGAEVVGEGVGVGWLPAGGRPVAPTRGCGGEVPAGVDVVRVLVGVGGREGTAVGSVIRPPGRLGGARTEGSTSQVTGVPAAASSRCCKGPWGPTARDQAAPTCAAVPAVSSGSAGSVIGAIQARRRGSYSGVARRPGRTERRTPARVVPERTSTARG